MLTEEKIKQIEHSFKHSNVAVIVVADKVYVAEHVVKNKRKGTIKFKECYEIDETCFTKDGKYYGDTLDKEYLITVKDEYAGNDYMYASQYFENEVISIKEVK